MGKHGRQSKVKYQNEIKNQIAILKQEDVLENKSIGEWKMK